MMAIAVATNGNQFLVIVMSDLAGKPHDLEIECNVK
jgi:hypothetical protein